MALLIGAPQVGVCSGEDFPDKEYLLEEDPQEVDLQGENH